MDNLHYSNTSWVKWYEASILIVRRIDSFKHIFCSAEEFQNGQCSWGFIKYVVYQRQGNHSRNGRENCYRPIERAKNMPALLMHFRTGLRSRLGLGLGLGLRCESVLAPNMPIICSRREVLLDVYG